MSDPTRPGSVVGHMPFVRHGGPRAAQFLREAREAMAASINTPERRAARRARILALPWAAQRLARIIDAPADRWTGYLPERRDPHTARESGGRVHPFDRQDWRENRAPQLLALRQLMADVAEAGAEQQGGADVVQG